LRLRFGSSSFSRLAGSNFFALRQYSHNFWLGNAVFRPPAAGYCLLLAGGLLFVLGVALGVRIL
jgi:hypothetical protein